MMFTECDWAFFIRQYGDDIRAQQSKDDNCPEHKDAQDAS